MPFLLRGSKPTAGEQRARSRLLALVSPSRAHQAFLPCIISFFFSFFLVFPTDRCLRFPLSGQGLAEPWAQHRGSAQRTHAPSTLIEPKSGGAGRTPRACGEGRAGGTGLTPPQGTNGRRTKETWGKRKQEMPGTEPRSRAGSARRRPHAPAAPSGRGRWGGEGGVATSLAGAAVGRAVVPEGGASC